MSYIGPKAIPNLKAKVDAKQDKLVSGVSIKTINGQEILGEGNLEIEGGGGGTGINVVQSTGESTTDVMSQKAVTDELNTVSQAASQASESASAASIAAQEAKQTAEQAKTDLAGDYYDKQEVDERISTIPKFAISVVDSLPGDDISDTTVYLVKENEDDGNLYTEYIHVGEKWEVLGSQKVDLTNYYTKEEAEKQFAPAEPTTPEEKVDSKSALDEVDTSEFTGGEIYEVENDETQGGKDTIYEWDAEKQEWVLKGLADIYVTKQEFEETIGDINSALTRLDTGEGV